MVSDKKKLNPYRPYDLESGDWYYDENVLKQMKQFFESESKNRAVVLQGNPGSGKSSTLRWIENNRKDLGEKYIPIYLDSRKYLNVEPEKLLFSIYNDVVEKLNKYGYQLETPVHFKRYHRIDVFLEMFLLTFDAVLESDITLLLILDEFGKLLEGTEERIVESVFLHFQNLEKNWTNYGIIFVGENKLIDITNSAVINSFLKTTHTIDIEAGFNEKSIRTLITEPVKNQLTYTEDALREIVSLCGNNLYLQQLICYYLVDILSESGENVCLKEHTQEAAQRILNEKKNEFVYAWEKKITSVNHRLLVAALADESVTERKENYYEIRDNKILDDVFKKDIREELRKLHKFGYIVSDIKGKRFSKYPFNIPLSGIWIRQEHPFFKTVIENLESQADKIRFESLIEELEKTPPVKVAPFDKEAILCVANKWNTFKKSIMKKETVVRNEQIEELLRCFFNLLNLNLKADQPATDNYTLIDIKNLNIGILDEAVCFVQARPELTEDDILNIENMATMVAEDTQTKLTLFFYFNQSPLVKSVVKETFLNLIALAESDLKKIMFAARPRDAFRKILLSRLSLQKVSPYQTAGPATAIFYGRSDIINWITGATDNSYAIVGARRIGKTSLLHKIVENLPPGVIHIYKDLWAEFSNVKSYNPFFRSLQAEIKTDVGRKVDLGSFLPGAGFARFPKLVKKFSKKNRGRRIVFIFDEIDGLLEFDKKHDFKLMSTFRTMSQKKICQFIFSGFRELYHQRRNINHPAYNFYEEILLTPLEDEAAIALVTKPMEKIGVHYESLEIRRLILGYTSRHPHLLQFFCKKLVEKVERHPNIEDRRTIFKKDIEGLFNTAYEEYIMDEVYMFLQEDLVKMNKLIIILMAEVEDARKRNYSTQEITGKLNDIGMDISMEDVHKNVRDLVMRFFLVDKGRDRYAFALPFFPDILRNWIDDDYKSQLIEEIKKDAGKSV